MPCCGTKISIVLSGLKDRLGEQSMGEWMGTDERKIICKRKHDTGVNVKGEAWE